MLGKQSLQLKPLEASPLYQRRKLSLQNEKESSGADPDYAELGTSNKNEEE